MRFVLLCLHLLLPSFTLSSFFFLMLYNEFLARYQEILCSTFQRLEHLIIVSLLYLNSESHWVFFTLMLVLLLLLRGSASLPIEQVWGFTPSDDRQEFTVVEVFFCFFFQLCKSYPIFDKVLILTTRTIDHQPLYFKCSLSDSLLYQQDSNNSSFSLVSN